MCFREKEILMCCKLKQSDTGKKLQTLQVLSVGNLSILYTAFSVPFTLMLTNTTQSSRKIRIKTFSPLNNRIVPHAAACCVNTFLKRGNKESVVKCNNIGQNLLHDKECWIK